MYLKRIQLPGMRALLALILPLLITTSCEKTILKVKIKGEVKGLNSGEPIADADVYVIRHKNTDMFSYGISKYVYQGKTDSQGKFEFEFNREYEWQYTVYTRKQNYFDEESTRGVQSYLVLNQRGMPFNRKINLYLCEESFINIRFYNKSGFNSGYKVESYSFYKNKTSESASVFFDCKNNDTTIYGFVLPSGTDFKFSYSILDQNNKPVSGNSILLPKINPKEEINYRVDY